MLLCDFFFFVSRWLRKKRVKREKSCARHCVGKGDCALLLISIDWNRQIDAGLLLLFTWTCIWMHINCNCRLGGCLVYSTLDVHKQPCIVKPDTRLRYLWEKSHPLSSYPEQGVFWKLFGSSFQAAHSEFLSTKNTCRKTALKKRAPETKITNFMRKDLSNLTLWSGTWWEFQCYGCAGVRADVSEECGEIVLALHDLVEWSCLVLQKTCEHLSLTENKPHGKQVKTFEFELSPTKQSPIPKRPTLRNLSNPSLNFR